MKRGPNPYCTTFQVLEQLAQAHSTAELLSALRHPRLPRSVREVLRFGHSGDDIDLPTHALAIEPISTRAYVEDNDAPFDLDLFGLDSGKLRKLYCKSGQPLNREKRTSLWVDFASRLSEPERYFMEHVRVHHEPPPEFAMICRGACEDLGVLDELQPLSVAEQQARYQMLYDQLNWN